MTPTLPRKSIRIPQTKSPPAQSTVLPAKLSAATLSSATRRKLDPDSPVKMPIPPTHLVLEPSSDFEPNHQALRTTWPSRYLGAAAQNSYPNAYPIDAERAKKGHVSRSRVIENIALRPMPFTYEPEGREFESLRAHHRIRDSHRNPSEQKQLVVTNSVARTAF
jgi:hypothetical protein